MASFLDRYRHSSDEEEERTIVNTGSIANSVISNNKVEKPINPNIQDDDGFSTKVNSLSDSDMGNQISRGNQGDIGITMMHSANLFRADEIRSSVYNKVFRFGIANPYSALSTAREYLFFTKPDLHIFEVSGSYNVEPSAKLNEALQSSPFWADLYYSRKDTTLKNLQASRDFLHPFNYLLQNQCKSNLDIPGLTSEMVDTPTNNYGVGYSYRGSSEASDDGPEFSLEFKDNRFLDTYYFFKAYEEYETMKHHGTIAPAKHYITSRTLHDCFSIYKIIVSDDMETIIYWGKMYGVVPKSLPRDVFSTPNFDDGLSYSIDFKAAFYEDMKPEILSDFNALGQDLYDSIPYNINLFNPVLGRPDTRPAEAPHVIVDTTSATAKASPAGYVYKLKWKGSSIK